MYFLKGIAEIQHLDFTCDNQLELEFMKYHVVRKNNNLHAGGHSHILDHTAHKYYWQ